MQDPRSVRKHLLVDPLRRRSNLRVRFRMHTLSMCTLGLHPPTRVFNAVPAKTDVQFPLAKAFLAEKYPDESSLDAVIGVDLHHTPPRLLFATGTTEEQAAPWRRLYAPAKIRKTAPELAGKLRCHCKRNMVWLFINSSW